MAMERVKKGDVSPTLPYDVMINILSRLPIKSIVRFRCVSKSWLTIYTDPHFVNLHLTQSPKFNVVLTYSANYVSTMTHLFVGSCDDREPTSHMISIPPLQYNRGDWMEHVRIAGSCRGLVLCCKRSGDLYLVNPSTREMVRLPDSPFNEIAASSDDYRSYGLGYDPSADDYKVVQLSSSTSGEIITSLYSLKSNFWRRIPDFPFSIAEFTAFDEFIAFDKFTASGVFLNGNLHWFNSDRTKMACFSLADETFRDVPLPDDNVSGPPQFEYLIGVVKGCLCIQSSVDWLPITLWVMKEYGRRDSWTKFEFDVPYSYIVKPLDFSNNDEHLFISGDAKFVMYNLNEKTYWNLEFHIATTRRGEAITCLESIVSPKCYIRKKRS